jgi:hypothetical protein
MRVLGLISGLAAAFSASAGDYDSRLLDSGAVAGQLVYEMRFGGEAGQPAARSLQLQIANEGQRLAGVAPLRAEYRHDTGQFLVNGLDVERTFMSRQEETGIGAVWGGWLPLLIVIGAAGLIVIDGQDQDPVTGPVSGGS